MKILSNRALQRQASKDASAQIDNLLKAESDAVAFIDNYLTIDTVIQPVSFKLSDPQKRLVNAMMSYDKVITIQPRRAGQTTAILSFILWRTLFKDHSHNVYVAPNGQMLAQAKSILTTMIHHCPAWIRPTLTRITLDSFEFDNGASLKIIASANGVTGRMISTLVLSDFAQNDHRRQSDLYSTCLPSVYPGGKVVIASTPVRSGDLFHALWDDAEAGNSHFHPVRVKWDEIFTATQYLQLYNQLGAQVVKREYDCEF